MAYTELLFIPISFTCYSDDDYKKIQSYVISEFEESKLLSDKIAIAFGVPNLDNGTIMCPYMRLYDSVDYSGEPIGAVLQYLCNDPNSDPDVASLSSREQPLSLIIDTTDEEWLHDKLQPVFKPLDLEDGSVVILFSLLPIVVVHEDEEKLMEAVNAILGFDVNDEDMNMLSEQLNNYFGFKKQLTAFPIGHSDFISETIDSIMLMFKESMASSPVTSTKIGRNDKCPCGSGKKYKACCLKLLNE